MEKELNYPDIEGNYGGNQEWFSYFSMRVGGCAAATACELLMYLSQKEEAYRELYPFDSGRFTKAGFNELGKRMRPYLKPRRSGINRLSIYMDGLFAYMEQEAKRPKLFLMEGYDGNRCVRDAEAFIRGRLEDDMPVPYLLLRHRDPSFDDITWHWFMLTGYEERPEGFTVRFATYGERREVLLERLWDTGYGEKGGMVGICLA